VLNKLGYYKLVLSWYYTHDLMCVVETAM